MSPINLSIDCVVLGFDEDQKLKVLLIKKFINEKNDYQFALPGDLVGISEDLLEGAARILKSLTSLDNLFLKQFQVFGSPERTKQKKDQSWLKMYRKKPKERVVTVGYIALVKMEDYTPHAASFAIDAEWVELKKVSPELFKKVENFVELLGKNNQAHGDLHLENIMISPDGKTFKVIDPIGYGADFADIGKAIKADAHI